MLVAIQAKLRLATKEAGRLTLFNAVIPNEIDRWFQQKNCFLKVVSYILIRAPVIDRGNSNILVLQNVPKNHKTHVKNLVR